MMNGITAQTEPEIDSHKLRLREKEEVVRWFDTFSDPVYGFIFYRVGRDADLAGDVAQETFVTALQTIDRFDPDREPLAVTGDVAGVVRGERVTRPDTGIYREVRITIRLKPEAVQRLRDYANANPDALIVADFNRRIKVVPSLTAGDPSLLSFDLSLLDVSLAELEQRYFTTTIERNGS